MMTRPPIHYLQLRIRILYLDYQTTDDPMVKWELGALLQVLIHALKDESGVVQTREFLTSISRRFNSSYPW